MNLGTIRTRIRRKLGEPDSGNSTWTDANITDAINDTQRRVYRKLTEAVPEAFRTTLDVTLSANTYEVDIGWTGDAWPDVLYPIYDITNSTTPGSLVTVAPRNMQPFLECVGVHGRKLYTTKLFPSDKTFRLIVVPQCVDLSSDSDESSYIPEKYMDVLIYGTAIDLQSEEPVEIPAKWDELYQDALQDLTKALRHQVRFNKPRFGERYVASRMSGYWRNHVR